MRLKTPLYHVIYSDIIRKVFSGKLRKGDRLKSNSAHCKEYGVSNITVRKAILLLREDGLISTRPRQLPTIEYDVDSPVLKERLCQILAAKRTEIRHMLMAHQLLLPPMLQASLKQYSQDERILFARK